MLAIHSNRASDLAPNARVDSLDAGVQEETVVESRLSSTMSPARRVPLEIEWNKVYFPIDGRTALRCVEPLRLRYDDEENKIEVIGWNVSCELHDAHSLERLVARRFLELFSRTVHGPELSGEDQRLFAEICRQVDYRQFNLDRALPRYEEGVLIARAPHLTIALVPERNLTVPSNFTAAFQLLSQGEHFGAEFEYGGEGEITAIRNLLLLPTPTDEAALHDMSGVEFDATLEDLLGHHETKG